MPYNDGLHLAMKTQNELPSSGHYPLNKNVLIQHAISARELQNNCQITLHLSKDVGICANKKHYFPFVIQSNTA